MLAMSLFLLHFISLFLLAVRFPTSHAFEFDLPSSIPTNEPITVGYRMKFDGSDETTWLMNITDVDGSNPEILNDGQLFERPFTRFFGSIQVTIDREGPFRLKAVNPEFLRQSYATSSPGFAIDFDPDGSGTDPRDDGHDENTNGDETEDEPGDETGGTSGNGSGSGDGDSDGDDDGETGSGSGNGNGSGSGSETDPDEDPEDVTTSASPSTATRRPSNVPNGPIGASKRGANTGLIAGCIAAGVAALLLVLAILFWLRRSNNRSKPGRPLTFYRDRMIRAPTPPPNQGPPPPPVHVSEPMSVIQNPHDYGHAGMAYLPGYGNVYPAYGQPHSASTAVGPPVMREFILRSPRMPASPNQPQLKEFILRSPRPGRESLAYSKP